MIQPMSMKQAAAVLERSFAQVAGPDQVVSRDDLAAVLANQGSAEELREAARTMLLDSDLFNAVARETGDAEVIDLADFSGAPRSMSSMFLQLFGQSTRDDNALSKDEGARLRDFSAYLPEADRAEVIADLEKQARPREMKFYPSYNENRPRRPSVFFTKGMVMAAANGNAQATFKARPAVIESFRRLATAAMVSPEEFASKKADLAQSLQDLNPVERVVVLNSWLDPTGAGRNKPMVRAVANLVLSVPMPNGEGLTEEQLRALYERLGMQTQQSQPPGMPPMG